MGADWSTSRLWSISAALVVLGLVLVGASSAVAAAAPITEAAEGLRTGWYPDEPQLTPQLLESGGFGLNFDTPVQGKVYAQPLVSGNVLFVATEDNWIYGIDRRSGAILWQRQVGTPWNPADLECDDLVPNVGITGTPVIDPSTDTAYFFSKTYVSGSSGPAAWEMHAVDVASGAEDPGFPVSISGEAENLSGVSFDAMHQLQRPGLLLMNGVVYAAFGSHCDHQPYQGWVIGVSTAGATRGQTATRWAAAREGAAIWQSGGGLVSDGEGQILFATGNSFGPAPAPTATPPEDLGESVVRLAVQPGGELKATDFFSPFNREHLDEEDEDLGSGAPLALPSPYFGTEADPHLLVDVGKEGIIYLLDREGLGGLGQGLEGKNEDLWEVRETWGVWGSLAVWPGEGGYVYVPGRGALEVVKYETGSLGEPKLSLAGVSHLPTYYGSGSPLVTSNGTESGSAIVWVSRCSVPSVCEGSTLDAYRAVPVGGAPELIWSGEIGVPTKFARPDASDGRIYVGTSDGHVVAFGVNHHTLTVAPPGVGGSVSSSVPGIECGSTCSHTYAYGEEVKLTATPSPHYEFTGWTGGGCAGSGACELGIYEDTSVSAAFAPIGRSLTVSTSGSGAGSVTSSPGGISCPGTCDARFGDGANVTLTATPQGSSAVEWQGCGSVAADACQVDLSADRQVTAVFTRPPSTKITETAIRRRSRSVTFHFLGFRASGFQCRLIRPLRGRPRRRVAFAPCRSPKRYGHLGPGHYLFEVRSVNAAGADPRPAKRKFRIG